MRLLLLIALAGALAYGAFAVAYRRARQSPQRRRQVLVVNLGALALGLVLALWLPHRLVETSGSPASLVATLVLWIVGGGLALLGLAAALGAYCGRAPQGGAAVGPPSTPSS